MVVWADSGGIETCIALKKAIMCFLKMTDRLLSFTFDEKPFSLIRDIIVGKGIKVLSGDKLIRILVKGKAKSLGLMANRKLKPLYSNRNLGIPFPKGHRKHQLRFLRDG